MTFLFLIFGNSLVRQVSNIVSVSGILDAEGPNALVAVLIRAGMFMAKLTREMVDDSSHKSFQALVTEEHHGRSVYEKSLLNWRLNQRQCITSSSIKKLDDFYCF